MTPGTLTIPIYRGAKWEHTFTFKQSGTETPVNLTGLGDLVFEVESARTGATIATADVTMVSAETGVVRVLLTAAVTKTFPLGTGTVKVGMRDGLNNPYIQGTLDVLHFTADPA